MKNYPLYEHPDIGTIRELLYVCDEMYGQKECFQYPKKKEDIVVTYSQFRQQVEAFGTWLYEQDYVNCHIAIFGENSYQWILSYFAVTCGANVAVPIDKELDAQSIQELLVDSECKAIIYSDTYEDIIEQLKTFNGCNISYINMSQIEKDVEAGKMVLQGGMKPLQADKRHFQEAKVEKGTLAAIVYTSGTTGKCKGVMLSHYNLISNLYGASQYAIIDGPSILLLPLHHTFGIVAGLFAVMYYGCPLYINKSLRQLSGDFQKCKPQNLFAVPLIVETLYKNIWATAKKQGKDKLLRNMMGISDALRKCKIDLRKVIFKSVLSAFGGEIEVIICGGASLDEKYVREFESLGITILNGYGITECGPIVAVNRNRYNHIGSVGLPLLCNKVKVAEDGEILVKGHNVMQGYYHNEEENAKVFTDGWFRTGDLGSLGKDGELYITGRKKNLIILGNGENISAESIEKEVYTISYVKEVIVYGEDDRIVAEVFLDEEYPDGMEMIHKDIQKVNQRLPQIKNIGKIVIRDTEFPKTTTKKIKRN